MATTALINFNLSALTSNYLTFKNFVKLILLEEQYSTQSHIYQSYILYRLHIAILAFNQHIKVNIKGFFQ